MFKIKCRIFPILTDTAKMNPVFFYYPKHFDYEMLRNYGIQDLAVV